MPQSASGLCPASIPKLGHAGALQHLGLEHMWLGTQGPQRRPVLVLSQLTCGSSSTVHGPGPACRTCPAFLNPVNHQPSCKSRAWRTDLQLAIVHVGQVGDPLLQAVKDVGGVDYHSPPLIPFLLEEGQKVQATHHIHVHCHLIQQQHLAHGQDGCWRVASGSSEHGLKRLVVSRA